MTFPASPTNDDMVFLDPVTYSLPIAPVVQCQFCRFWKADEDGMAGECISPFMAEMVWAKWDEGSPIVTAWNFEEPKFFEAVVNVYTAEDDE